MKRILILISCFVLIAANENPLYSWGFFGHKKINRMAVLVLPTELMAFYKKHIEFITEHAVDPDKRDMLLLMKGQDITLILIITDLTRLK